ncbi:uncharacterized protein ACIQIH_019500 isoform 2-T2 [Cyanocitta cristata]
MGHSRMRPSSFWGFCLVLLCSGAALGFQEEEPGNGSVTQPEEPPGPPGHPTTATGHAGTTGTAGTTWLRATTTPPWSGDLAVTPEGNQTRTSSGVPVRYWSPVLFVLLALLVLFVTYQRTKGKDLGALVQPPVHDPIPKIPALQRERKDPETPPGPDHTETTFSQPEPSQAPGVPGEREFLG